MNNTFRTSLVFDSAPDGELMDLVWSRIEQGFIHYKTCYHYFDSDQKMFVLVLENLEETKCLVIDTPFPSDECCAILNETIPGISWELTQAQMEDLQAIRLSSEKIEDVLRNGGVEVDASAIETANTFRFYYQLENEKVTKFYPKVLDRTFNISNLCQGAGPLDLGEKLKRVFVGREFLAEQISNQMWEEVLGLELSDRAMALRMVYSEICRLKSHFIFFLKLSITYGNEHLYKLCLSEYRRVSEMYSMLSDSEGEKTISHPGGFWKELRAGGVTLLLAEIKDMLESVSQMEKVFVRNPYFISSSKNCKLTGQDAVSYGMSGPNLRASGINYDLRKRRPRYFYSDIDFNYPLGVSGTSYDRVLVRYLEIIQGAQVLTQILDNMPLGEARSEENLDKVKSFYKGDSSISDHIYFGDDEGPEGATGLSAVFREGKLHCLKLLAPSLKHLRAATDLFRGSEFTECKNAFSSLNVYKYEVEQ